RGSAEDPSNLLQIMLAKGCFFSSGQVRIERRTMNANERSSEPLNGDSLNRESANEEHDSTNFNSSKVYVAGRLHPHLRVPFREIKLSATKTFSGQIEVNEPVRVYDTSGPWGDPGQQCEVREGLQSLRRDWIAARGDVEEYSGREVQPR